MNTILRLLVIGALLTITDPVAAGEIIGRATVIDGDTLEVRGQRVRLFGIDAPEADQSCTDAKGRPWPCGRRAAFALADRLGYHAVHCQARGKSYERLVAVCHVGDIDIAAWLVETGWAAAERDFSDDYVDAERRARREARNIWQGPFTPPAAWRAGKEARSDRAPASDHRGE